ncbi:unnamed protein product [Meganyctiphanes norvegica]|uniref:RNA-directed DNA polymerase n=1 Tax=Meganyctiphanes norvegica TaxID=48144 RepID=A0AAV2SUM8_MEGNR
MTLVGSRFTQPAESRYAPVEGEALGVVYALDKARYFVQGCTNLIIAVDHKPLLKLFSDRALEDIPNCRLRNLKEKTLRYRFRMIHIPGVKNKVADDLSRHPAEAPSRIELHDVTANTSDENCLNEDTIEEHTIAATTSIFNTAPITAVTWTLIQQATTSDEDLSILLELIESGFPEDISEVPNSIRYYFPLRDSLSTVQDVEVYKDRILIPTCLRQNCLSTLHAAHQGVSKMLARAESSIYWPGITKDIQETRDKCENCNRNAPSNANGPPHLQYNQTTPSRKSALTYSHTKESAT